MNRVHQQDYRVVQEILQSIDHSRALTVVILMRYHEWDQIIGLSFNPLDYNCFSDARDALLATELLRKTSNLPTTVDRKKVALNAFLQAEDVCKSSNIRLAEKFGDSRLMAISRKISNILGPIDADAIVKLSGWGPGVTLTLRGSDAHLFNKFDHDGESTPLCNAFIKPWFSMCFPTWKIKPRIMEGNRVITVPKNAKTDRTIAVEPSLNLFFQKGVGSYIRSRLHKFGIDLKDQRHNQRLARLGSKFNSLATVDFSMASDTICSRLILELLPFDWFRLLDILRSPRGVLGDSIIEYEKFSSMGNGFTFELESLIFYCAALVCVPEDHPELSNVSVYGDDVVIPADCIDDFNQLCQLLGFTLNTSKSYSSGYYRESCGEHYWNGLCITPFYIRELPQKRHLEIYKIHNALERYSRRILDNYSRDKRFLAPINYLRSLAKKLFIPDGVGDGGFVASFDESCPVRNRRYQRGYNYRHYVFESSKVTRDSHGVLLTRLYAPSVDSSYGNTLPEPRRGRYLTLTSFTPTWSDIGSWI